MIDPKLPHINKQNCRKEFAMFSEFVKEKSEYMTASACSEQTGSFTAPEKNAAEATCETRENFENCENGARKTAGTFNAINMWSALVSVALFLFAYGFFSLIMSSVIITVYVAVVNVLVLCIIVRIIGQKLNTPVKKPLKAI